MHTHLNSITIFILTIVWFEGIFILAVNNSFNYTLGRFPLALIPGFLVPFCIIAHHKILIRAGK